MDSSTNFLHQLASLSRDLLLVYDLDRRVFTYLSESAVDFFGVPAEELLHKPIAFADLIQPEDQQYVLDQVRKLGQEVSYINVEFRMSLPDRQVKWVQLKAYVLKNASLPGKHIAGIAEDISKRKGHEISLYTIKEQKDTVLQILGHDLRAPLNTISSAITLINRQISDDAKVEVQKFLDIISTISTNSLHLINEVLKSEFMETQKMGMKFSRFDVVERIQKQLETYRLVREEEKQFFLHAPEEAVYITTEAIRFMLIFENLLSNAYKFSRRNGRIDIRVEKKEAFIKMLVSDDGVGIPDALKPYIFDKFTKARRPGYRGEKPVGLGLHLVKTMVEQLGGKLWFESQEGKGTTFYVEIPDN